MAYKKRGDQISVTCKMYPHERDALEVIAKLAGWEGIEVTDGDPCEAQDNTADITELKALGWKPKVKVDEYIVQHTIPN